jgi:hypothetical protein
MIPSRIRTRLLTWAGLWAGGLAWAVNTQLGQILPLSDCTRQLHLSAFFSLALAGLALIGAFASFSMTRDRPAGFGSPQTLRFDAGVSALAALIFVFALLLQLAASWMLTGCER